MDSNSKFGYYAFAIGCWVLGAAAFFAGLFTATPEMGVLTVIIGAAVALVFVGLGFIALDVRKRLSALSH